MSFLIPLVCVTVMVGLLGILAYLMILLKVINRLTDTNKQLLVVVAGKNEKPETLRALVASSKPPQGKLRGIADGKKKKEVKPENTNYTLDIGVADGL